MSPMKPDEVRKALDLLGYVHPKPDENHHHADLGDLDDVHLSNSIALYQSTRGGLTISGVLDPETEKAITIDLAMKTNEANILKIGRDALRKA